MVCVMGRSIILFVYTLFLSIFSIPGQFITGSYDSSLLEDEEHSEQPPIKIYL